MPKKKQQVGANEPCPCGSGKKYIECCLDKGYEFVRSTSGKVSKRVKFRKSKKPKKSDVEKEFTGDIVCRQNQDVKEEDIPLSLRKKGAIYRIGPSFDDIPAEDIKILIPIVGVDFVEGSYSFIRALFLPKVSLSDLRRIYEILEMEKLRVTSYLTDAVLADEPHESLSGAEDILLLVITKDHRRHFNIREDYAEFGLFALRDLVGFFESTKLEVLLEIIRRSLSEGLIKSIMSDL